VAVLRELLAALRELLAADAPPNPDAEVEIDCRDVAIPPGDPFESPAFKRSKERCAKLNLERRRERARNAKLAQDEAIRRSDRDAAVIAGAQFREADRAARRDQRLLFGRAVREGGHRPATRGRGAGRPRGARPRGDRTSRATRAGPEDGDPEPAGAGDPVGVETSRSSLAGAPS
jgi:hypothetical protein